MLNPVVAIDTTLSYRGLKVARSAAIRIGELAGRTGCNIETIRYYERIGLVPHPARSAGRYRLYETEDVRRLAFVRRARELGFSLDEVRTLLALSAEHGDSTCGEVRELAARHLADVRVKIADLRAMQRALTEAVRLCDAGQLAGCPLIDTLSTTAPLHLVSRRPAPNPTPAA
jgi:MerR family mercuric resistance operon transcriptional regulator